MSELSKMKRLLHILVLFFITYVLQGQDTLLTNRLLASATEDINNSERIELYQELVKSYLPDSALLAVDYARKALHLATGLENESLKVESKFLLGLALFEMNDYNNALQHFDACKSYFKKNSHKSELAEVYFKTGLINFYTGHYSGALENFLSALKAYKNLNEIQNIAQVYQNLGLVYYELGDIDKTLVHYNKSLDINSDLKNEERCASLLHNIGVVYYNQGKYVLARKSYEKSLKIFRKLGFNEGIASTLSNIGLIYEIQKNYPDALKYYKQALSVFNEIDYRRGIALATYNVGSAYHNLKKHSQAAKYYNQSMNISKKHNFNDNLMDTYLSLSNLYEESGLHHKALAFYKSYNELSDSLNSLENSQKLADIESRYDLELKEQEIAKKTAELKQKTTINYAFVIGIILLSGITMIILKQNKNKKRVQKELEKHRDQLEDLVKQRTAELKLEISERKIAEESDKLKSAFLANMSHEIRTPMNSIISFSNFLKDPQLTEDKKNEYIGYITSCGRNLLQLIDDIIDSAKIEAKQLVIHKTSCNINQLLYELYSIFKESKSKMCGDIELVLNIENPNKDYIIQTDYNRLQQVLSNLLENAFKYTKSGKIEFGFVHKTKHLLEFFVNDSGIGISGEKVNFIFERFRQVEIALDKKLGGTGLGLAISRNLVELLGGKIWVISRPNEGSSFRFTIPYNHLEYNKAINQQKKEKIKSPVVPDWKDKRVLIAEDEDLNFRVIEIALRKTNAEVLRAKDGIEAVDFCRQNRVDMVLMDIQMPRKDGYTATREIKNINRGIPVIAQTSFAMLEDQDKCRDAGCDDYLSKPINHGELIHKMGKYLNASHSMEKPSVKNHLS